MVANPNLRLESLKPTGDPEVDARNKKLCVLSAYLYESDKLTNAYAVSKSN